MQVSVVLLAIDEAVVRYSRHHVADNGISRIVGPRWFAASRALLNVEETTIYISVSSIAYSFCDLFHKKHVSQG